MCRTLPIERPVLKTLTDVINEDLPLYSAEELVEIINASMILFTRALLNASLRIDCKWL